MVFGRFKVEMDLSLNPNAEDDDNFSLDYNRVKIRTIMAKPSLIWRNNQNTSMFTLGMFYESNEVNKTSDRFISETNQIDDSVFDKQDF